MICIEDIIFVGIDSWCRPVFKSASGNYFGSVYTLFPEDTVEEVVVASITEKDLLFFGRRFGCEPDGNDPWHQLRIRLKNSVPGSN